MIPSSTPNTVVMTTKEPLGVCGIITPWNFPTAIICRKVAPALGSGCTVIIKPPSETLFTCPALTAWALEAGVPGKVLHVCPTKYREVASELARHPLVRKISFSGSTSVGKSLAKLASGTLKKLSLELGDLRVCQPDLCSKRSFGRVTRRLAPLINPSAVDKVKSHIEDTVSKGARVEIGGSTPGVVQLNHHLGDIKESSHDLEGSKYGMVEYRTIKSIILGNIHL
ncbi:hypothetical protein RU639_003687 [Aspergillus parasiticus]